MFSFDTNVLAYAADSEAGARHDSAKRLIKDAAHADARLNEQSLIEFLRFAIHKKSRPLTEAAEVIGNWRATFPVMGIPDTAIEGTVALLRAHRLSVWDAHMLAVCGANNCDVLLSEDMSDGARYGSVQVMNPFNPRNAGAIARLLGA